MSEHTAGDELDRLVATTVFGQMACSEYHYVRMGHIHGWTRNEPHADHSCYPDQCPAQYSQLIQAAWMVVEKMRECGFRFSLFDAHTWIDGPLHYSANFTILTNDPHNPGFSRQAEALTAPHAICLAALAASKQAKP
jgi:hypothetical protein